VGGDENVDAARVHEGHPAEVSDDPRRRRLALTQQRLAEYALDVAVDLAAPGHHTDSVDHAVFGGQMVGLVGLLGAGHGLLDCDLGLPSSGRGAVILPPRYGQMHPSEHAGTISATCMAVPAVPGPPARRK
jgi:hypothetical protein